MSSTTPDKVEMEMTDKNKSIETKDDEIDMKISRDKDEYNEWYRVVTNAEQVSDFRTGCAYVYKLLVANQSEFLSGITVALALVPEAVAFAFVAGVTPYVGLTAAWIVGLTTSILGGRPGMISGATGAMAVVMPDLVKEWGAGGLFYAVLFTGIIQIVLGALRIDSYIRFISHPIMIGFCNGLAIVIALAQFHSFKVPAVEDSTTNSTSRRVLIEAGSSWGAFTDGKEWEDGESVGWMILLVFITMATCFIMPHINKRVPGPLVAIFLCTVIEHGILRAADIGRTNTVKDTASVSGNFPIPMWADSDIELPTVTWDFVKDVLPTSIILALIGLIESLMTAELLTELTKTPCDLRRECFGQGIANILAGMFGSMGGCAMIGQSMINVHSGGTRRLSGIIAALGLLIIVVAAYPLINLIPVASLAGVMFMVCYHTFEWDSVLILWSALQPQSIRDMKDDKKQGGIMRVLSGGHKKIMRTDAAVIVLVTMLAIVLDLATAVIAGVVLSSMCFAWTQSSSLGSSSQVVKHSVSDMKDRLSKCRRLSWDATSPSVGDDGDGGEQSREEAKKMLAVKDDDVTEDGGVSVKVYSVRGPIFFSSVKAFKSIFDVEKDPKFVEVHLHNAQICDYSGLEAINSIAEQYKEAGKVLTFRHLCQTSAKMFKKAKNLVTTSVNFTVSSAAMPAPAHHLHVESRGL